jgi:hypothetical protein
MFLGHQISNWLGTRPSSAQGNEVVEARVPCCFVADGERLREVDVADYHLESTIIYPRAERRLFSALLDAR